MRGVLTVFLLRSIVATFLFGVSVLGSAEGRESTPRFTAHVLAGETFTSDSLKGKVVLLQFWTTWCPYCRRDQPFVDNIDRDFASQGLVVLAVDVRESEDTVRKYLQASPRTCRIVLTEDTNLVAEFAPHGFPFYVVVDRDGNIAGTQHGAGGEESLRGLLRRAGLGLSPGNEGPNRKQRSSAAQTTVSGSAQLIEVPRAQSVPASKPKPPAVFVLVTGERLEAPHYIIAAGTLRVGVGGQQRTIPLNALDQNATIKANHERGIELRIPTSPSEILLSP